MESIKKFVAIDSSGFNPDSDSGSGYGSCSGYDSGSGYGSGSGFGYDSGSGYGSGSGSGSGFGYDSGSGHGYGSGQGYSIKSRDGKDVHLIDGIQTIIAAVFGNTAKGFILENDLTLTPCYIAKSGNTFAHGYTLKSAVSALSDKLLADMSEEDRIAEFLKVHTPGVKYPAKDLFDWHNNLTGSCEAGRMSFVRSHDIDLDHDTYTVEEFVALCKDSYGGQTIQKLLATKKIGRNDEGCTD